jgi:hypothetical protein
MTGHADDGHDPEAVQEVVVDEDTEHDERGDGAYAANENGLFSVRGISRFVINKGA